MTKYGVFPRKKKSRTYTAPITSFVTRTEVAIIMAFVFRVAIDSLTNIENASPKEPLTAEAAEATTSAACG